jgi:ribosomal protein S18 acetylase RimI-like enzyme
MLRDLRPADAPRLLEFLQRDFPEEERLLGTRPEGFERITRRVFRWDTRLVLGLLRGLGRPLFRFLVVEADGRVVGTTLLTFPPRAGYLSMVVVDPAYRRRGYAKALLEEARATAARRRKSFVVLDVLEGNQPARALYEAMGYRRLRSASFLTHERPDELPGPLPPPAGIRPFRRSDARMIAAIALRQMPPEVATTLPAQPGEYVGNRFVANVLGDETASWVVDRGAGAEAYVGAGVSPATAAGHLTAPVVAESVDPALAATLVRTAASWVVDRGAGAEAYVGAGVSPATAAGHLTAPVVAESVDPALAATLVRTAASWVAARHPPRVVTRVTEENRRGRAALEEVGFREALAFLTLARPVA